ncbi:MAG: AEC family transporter [Pseudooceanicola sp.]|nr:AEC family transporter [Pseudooceanicola sp.]
MLTAIWPIFALICLGFILARSRFPAGGFWAAAERINYFLLFPALLVASLAVAPVRDPALWRLGSAAAATLLAAAAVLWVYRRVRPMPAARFGPALQGCIRFNTYMALSLLAVLSGPPALQGAAIFLAIAVPLGNLLSILALGTTRSPVDIARTVLRNPLILACLAGIVLSLSGIGLPFGTGDFLHLVGQGSLPLGLLCVGAALQPATLRADLPGLAATTLARLLLVPVLAATIALVFRLPPTEALVLLVFSAVPAAPTSYVLTRQMNGDGPFMAGIITLQTIAAALTLPLVLHLA